MRRVHLLPLLASLLLAPVQARAQVAPLAPTAPTAPGATLPAKPEPPTPPPAPRRAESRALAIALEILVPLGGAGCFYRHREVAGALVAAGSLIAGGLLLYAAQHGDRDATIINAVAYGATRSLGIAAAAQGTTPPSASSSAPPALATRALGLGYGFSF